MKPCARYVMPFGKYKGFNLRDISNTDEGLLYLDWLRGEREDDPKNDALEKNLFEFLDDATVAKELSDAIRDKREEEEEYRWGDRPEDHA